MRRVGLGVRVLAVALVPAVVFLAVAGQWSRREFAAADRARTVHREVGDLTGLLELKSALLLARIPVEVDVRTAFLGVDRAAAREALDIKPMTAHPLADVAAALGALVPEDRPFGEAELAELEARVVAGSTVALLRDFDQLDARTDRVWDRRLLAVRYDVVDLGDRELAVQLNDLEEAATVGATNVSMITGLAAVWFSGDPGGPVTGRDRAALAAAAADFDRSLRALAASPEPAVASSAGELRDRWDGGGFRLAVEAATTGQHVAPAAGTGEGIVAVFAPFRDAFDLFAPVIDILRARSSALEHTAAQAASRSTRTARLTIATTVGVLLAAMVLSLLVAASFQRPLRRLIDGLRKVGAGRLDVDPVPMRGPLEVVEASAAFNDVARSLHLVGAKVAALSEARLTDPHLDEPLPGELGEALASSIEVLAASIRERADLHDHLVHEASHDQLTGVANRSGTVAALDEAAATRSADHPVLVAFLDLDGFKRINDSYGHRTGDLVLIEVAARLGAVAGPGRLVGRYGGDEFVVVAPDVADEDAAVAFAGRLAAALAEPIALPWDEVVAVGASIGLALGRSTAEPAMVLLDRADRASLQAKQAGTGIELAPMAPSVPPATDPSPAAHPAP